MDETASIGSLGTSPERHDADLDGFKGAQP